MVPRQSSHQQALNLIDETGTSLKSAALYVRVSSGEQHTEAQERGLREYIPTGLWMIGVNSKVGKEERLTTGLGAAAVWFHRHEDPVDLS